MKATDFIKDYESINSDDKNATYFHANTMFKFAEDYHQAKLKLLTIPVVVGQSEQLKPMVFELANKLAIAGHGNEAVSMHRIHNRL